MDGTDRHCRYFHRLLSKHARLYTEMITASAILHGDCDALLGFDESEHPVALQIGGSEPALLAEASMIGEAFGYDEINLNVGCPSDRVQSGAFGACLMKTPALVADCVAAMQEAVQVPVTVKCRLGVDDQIPAESLPSFVETVAAVGCKTFIVHARMAWLEGLSPKENRTIPPLDYDLVRKLKRDRPDLSVILNGGIESIDEAVSLVVDFDGVMLGRAAYGQPFLLAETDAKLFGDSAAAPSREEVVKEMSAYLRAKVKEGVRPHAVTRHMLGLFHGAPGARGWRRFLSENASIGGGDLLDRALDQMRAARDRTAAAQRSDVHA